MTPWSPPTTNPARDGLYLRELTDVLRIGLRMTTKDQAIARFIEAVKLDRHDWEDWPKDSREAFVALQQPAPDCRTCERRDGTFCGNRIHRGIRCTNGDQYQPAPALVLWRTE